MTNEQAPMERDDGAVRPASPWRFAPIACVAACVVVAYAMGWHHYLSLDYLGDRSEALKAWVRGSPILAPLGFMLVFTLSVALSVPASSVLTIFGGFLFGFAPGAFYALISAVFGATAIFLAARTAFGDFLRRKAGSRAGRLAAGFHEDAFTYLLVLRFAPFIPFAVVNIASALFNVRLATFVTATFIGIIPAICAYAWLGQSLDSVLLAAKAAGHHARPSDLLTPQIIVAFAALALVALLTAIVRKVRGQR